MACCAAGKEKSLPAVRSPVWPWSPSSGGAKQPPDRPLYVGRPRRFWRRPAADPPDASAAAASPRVAGAHQDGASVSAWLYYRWHIRQTLPRGKSFTLGGTLAHTFGAYRRFLGVGFEDVERARGLRLKADDQINARPIYFTPSSTGCYDILRWRRTHPWLRASTCLLADTGSSTGC